MKNKIAIKLFLFFSCALILFAFIIGGIFSFLFSKHTIDLEQQNLEKRAVQIADTLSAFWNTNTTMHKSGMGGYMRFLDDIAMSEVWVVDTQYQFISWGNRATPLNSSELPEDGLKVINSAMTGTISFSQSFSDLLGTESTTVGAPIVGENENILGVVLLHAPISDTSNSISSGLTLLLISFFVALLLALPASYLLSLKFTKPLHRMKASATLLSEGHYDVRTEIFQKDEIGELATTIDQMAYKLSEAAKERNQLDTMRKNFTANVSHELRTPVTVLRGSLEALCDGIITNPAQVDEYHHQMLKETSYLERLVNDLLELSRLQNLNFKIDMSSFNFIDLLFDVNRSIRKLAQEKQISIIKSVLFEKVMISGDYVRLRQMLLIVLDNAIKFTPANANIYIELLENDALYLLNIRDEGCGIPEDELPFIFDRFHKTHDETNKNGSGLGLAIAKQIAERHNIQILVSSEWNVGTQFSFLIHNVQ